ncbi:hypothetical protein GCM10029992_60040 [Glycomyces albus]
MSYPGSRFGGRGQGRSFHYSCGVTAAHPIEQAWLSTGGTGAKNYDEFPDETEITRIVEANPASVLGVEMPAHTPRPSPPG